jgi:hypothetical protein
MLYESLYKDLIIEVIQCLFANWYIGVVLGLGYPSIYASLGFLAWNYWSKNHSQKDKQRLYLAGIIPVLIVSLMLFIACPIHNNKVLLARMNDNITKI